MELSLDFAFRNRGDMLSVVLSIIQKVLKKEFSIENVINIHHNYAAIENHFGKNVYVHRKGATKAYEGQFGIIPGSMGSNSYIVKGLGNRESFKSCSHGAGRVMGRSAAKKQFTAGDVIKDMKKKNISVGKKDMKDIAEECVWAYKDIDQVMENQKDLVEIVHKLTPILVVKG